jgi:hypothetical protein
VGRIILFLAFVVPVITVVAWLVLHFAFGFFPTA